MEIVHEFAKERREFGTPCLHFSDSSLETQDVPPDEEVRAAFLERNPCSIDVECIPDLSEHEVNTDVVAYRSIGMLHQEGGWPKDVDITEPEHKIRYVKRTEKNEEYVNAVKRLAGDVDHAIKQNNAIDIYEEYFSGSYTDHSSEPPSTKTINVFKDYALQKHPGSQPRTATSISWYPDGARRIAVAYSMLTFQREVSTDVSYIWDVSNPNSPEMTIEPSSPLVCLEYNPKDYNVIIGGSYNGLIAYWDTRRGPGAIESSPIEKSHRDPVYQISWLQSKTGTECASASTDGQVLWWDIRKLGEPTESMTLETDRVAAVDGEGQLGGVSMEYSAAGGPTMFLVGTEQGVVVKCNRKAKNPQDRIMGAYVGHHGPIYALARNPFFPKYFLSIGDWTARIWMEDLKTPIMTTKYHKSYLTSGCWSPSRPGVFFTTKLDGQLDIWDYFYKQNQPTLTQQVSDAALQSLKVEESGKYVAVGDIDGSTHILEICDGLSVIQSNEKASINQMFERETKREKNLEARAKELRIKKKKEAAEAAENNTVDDGMEETLTKVEENFFKVCDVSPNEEDGQDVENDEE